MNLMYDSMFLKDKISMHKKDELKVLAADLDLSGISRLKKDELAERIAERLLDPEVMFYRMSVFDDKGLQLFEKGIGGCYCYNYDESDIASQLNEIEYAAMNDKIFFVFRDVAEVWKNVRDEKFEAYRKRASWVWKCLYWTEEMYGFTPLDIFLDVVNTKKAFRMTAEELINIFDHFPEDRLWTIRLNDVFLSEVYAGTKEKIKRLGSMQADKEYYIPSVSEVEELFDTCALLSDPACQRMKKFIIREMLLAEQDAEDILYDLWGKLSVENDPHDALQWCMDHFEFQSDDQVQKFVNLFMALANGTRMLQNRGHKPSELRQRMKFGPGNMPTIMAGSSMAAEMLEKAAPEIRKMGFGLDLDSNADSIPVMKMPEGQAGPVELTRKKIYPNDPCPCGSGKKYKKCCGKNK